MKTLTGLLLTVLCTINLCLANGAVFKPAPKSGGIVPHDIKGVQMIFEEVHIYFDSTVCLFVLKNHHREPVNFTMGFPFNYSGGMPSPESTVDHDSKNCNFEVIVDQERPDLTFESSTKEIYSFVYTWDVAMNPGEEKEIICRYKTLWSHSLADGGTDHLSTWYLRSPAKFWHDKVIEAHFYLHLRDIFDPSNFYKDVIHDQDNNYMQVEPAGYYYNLSDGTLEWHEYNVDEMEDISFQIGPARITYDFSKRIRQSLKNRFGRYSDLQRMLWKELKSEQDLERVLADLRFGLGDSDISDEEWYKRFVLRLLRNYYFAKNGWEFQDPDLNEIFEVVRNDNKYRPYDEFEDVQKQNIEFIKNYEEKYYRFDE